MKKRGYITTLLFLIVTAPWELVVFWYTSVIMFNGKIRYFQNKDKEAVEKIFDLYWQDDFRKHLSDKLDKYIHNDPGLLEQNFKFFVAEENKEIVGVAAVRKAPDHIAKYALTQNSTEFYVLA